jgi:hypothetical protein
MNNFDLEIRVRTTQLVLDISKTFQFPLISGILGSILSMRMRKRRRK